MRRAGAQEVGEETCSRASFAELRRGAGRKSTVPAWVRSLCGARCCRVFLMDPLKYEVPLYEVPAEEQEQEVVVTD